MHSRILLIGQLHMLPACHHKLFYLILIVILILNYKWSQQRPYKHSNSIDKGVMVALSQINKYHLLNCLYYTIKYINRWPNMVDLPIELNWIKESSFVCVCTLHNLFLSLILQNSAKNFQFLILDKLQLKHVNECMQTHVTRK